MGKGLLEDFAKTFFASCEDLLEQYEADLLLLDKQKENIPSLLLENLFATVHSMKGRCGVFGYEKEAALLQELENVFQFLKEGSLVLKDGIVDLFFEVHDFLAQNEFFSETEAEKLIFKLRKILPGREAVCCDNNNAKRKHM